MDFRWVIKIVEVVENDSLYFNLYCEMTHSLLYEVRVGKHRITIGCFIIGQSKNKINYEGKADIGITKV